MKLTSTGRDEEPLVLHESVLVVIVKASHLVMNVMKQLLKRERACSESHLLMKEQTRLLMQIDSKLEAMQKFLDALANATTHVHHNHNCNNFYGNVSGSDSPTILKQKSKR